MQALDTFLRQATDRSTVPGAVVCVASRGQVVWQQAYGAAAFIPQYRPMRCDTLFDIASLTTVWLVAARTPAGELATPCDTAWHDPGARLGYLDPRAFLIWGLF